MYVLSSSVCILKLTDTLLVTIQKLDMDRAEKRALFDADWVPQVTYELITSESPLIASQHKIGC